MIEEVLRDIEKRHAEWEYPGDTPGQDHLDIGVLTTRVRILESALRVALGQVWSPPQPAKVPDDYQAMARERNAVFEALNENMPLPEPIYKKYVG